MSTILFRLLSTLSMTRRNGLPFSEILRKSVNVLCADAGHLLKQLFNFRFIVEAWLRLG